LSPIGSFSHENFRVGVKSIKKEIGERESDMFHVKEGEEEWKQREGQD